MEVSTPAWDIKYNKQIYAISPKYSEYASQFKILDHKLQDQSEDKNDEYNKNERYKCLDCEEFLIPHRGTKNRWHFQHHQNSQCKFDETFSINNESDTHKLAKYMLVGLIKQKFQITISGTKCIKYNNCTNTLPSHNLEYKEGDKVKIEYVINKTRNTRADVVIINNNEIRYIFEVYHTSKTKSERPDKWFEIKALEILKYDNPKDIVILTDIKDYDCKLCQSYQQIISNCKPMILESSCNRNNVNNNLKCSNTECKNISCLNNDLCLKCLSNKTEKNLLVVPSPVPCINFEFTCKNYEFCGSNTQLYDIFCDKICGRYDILPNSILDIRNTESKCSICEKHTEREMKHPYCKIEHYFCVPCCRNILLWDETKYHLSPIPYGCPPCPNKHNNPTKGTQCYCCEYNDVQLLWESNNPYQYKKWYEAENNSIHNSKSINRNCPLCKPKNECSKIEIIEKKSYQKIQ